MEETLKKMVNRYYITCLLLLLNSCTPSEEQLLENLYTFFNSLELKKSLLVKGNYIKKVTLCSTMGPGIDINYKTFY